MICDSCLNKFKSKRELWAKCFLPEDRNSIVQQAYQMIWNATVFRLINHARKMASEDSKGRKEISGTLHHFIDECFFDSQFSTIRRLTDLSALTGREGVFSLLALLKDMKANVTLMTRSHFFIAEGKEYDYEAVEKRSWEYRKKHTTPGVPYCLPRELESDSLKYRHKQIDKLSGVGEDQRKPEDCISEKVFDHLIKKIEVAVEKINIHVNKNIAHAATPESRGTTDQLSITLDDLWNAHKVICQAANFINSEILASGCGGFLPTPQFDHLKFLDKPLVTPAGIEILNNEWQEFNKEADSWGHWGIKEIEQEMGSALNLTREV